jgi:BirA family biotin operon repressor/biotin-[acetyl-CoA-carboxylase] ligase
MVKELAKFLKRESLNSTICPTIYYYSELGSTSNTAKELNFERQDLGFVILSKEQTGGYGQRGKFWESPKGGLWCSISIKPKFKPYLTGLVPILTALSVAKALEEFDISTKLKWPNDILHSPDNKKIGGILVEGKVSQHTLEYLIIGIGLNINNTFDQYSLALREKIITTYEILNTKIPLMGLLSKILSHIENELDKIYANREMEILSEWKKWDNILGLDVRLISNDIEYQGIAKDISRNGQLLLELKNGRTKKFSSGHLIISH